MSDDPKQSQHRQEPTTPPTSTDLLQALREGGKENLKSLLDQVDKSKPIDVDRNLYEAMTEEERHIIYSELSHGKKTFFWTGCKCIRDPDDPIFKEGWTVTFGGLRGRSWRPSGSTPVRKYVPIHPEQDKK